MMESQAATPGGQPGVQVVEEGKRLSECLLWRLQETFYASAGLDAWNAIPYYPTSNAFIADLYAELILGFILDYADALDWGEPLYILELAAGSGVFSFYLLRALQRKLACFERLRDLNLRYVMTDFADSIIRGWGENGQFKPFIGQGTLDFAIFRPEDQEALRLVHANRELQPGEIRNPVIAIANYFFDSIRQDLFRVSDHRLQEGRVAFHRALEGFSSDSPVTLEQLVKTEHFQPVTGSPYADARLDGILEQYTELFENASILFPLGALRCIENLQRLGGNGMVLIAADKGFTDTGYMTGHKEQFYTPHQGAFSFMVNFDAIARYFTRQGGFAMTDPGNTSVLNMLVGGTLPGFEKKLEQLSYRFEERIVRQDAANGLNLARRFVHPVRYDALGLLRAGLALIQLGGYDPLLFCECAPFILEGIGDALLVTDYRNLLRTLAGVRRNLFAADTRLNVYDPLEEIYFKLRCYRECIEVARQSLETLGSRPHALMHLAAAHESLGETQEALRHYRQAAELDPTSEIISAALKRLQP